MKALARAAQVAALHDEVERARGFFELALSGTPAPEALALLEQAAQDSDAESGDDRLRRALCSAMASGGQGARDGGRTRGLLLRRAASLVHRALGDLEQAFTWLGDALIAHVDPATLDALEALAREVGDPRRAEVTLSRALGEVFDVPLVRQLLARRAKLRRGLEDASGAAADYKKLHELSPTDQGVADELSMLLGDLGDFPAMVQLYEDSILRGKDMAVRIELARKVASIWQDQLIDPREAADAWRRVLRMRPGDADATAGLERAKSNMLRKREASDRPSEGASASSEVPPSPVAETAAATPATPPASGKLSDEEALAAKAREIMDTLSPDGDSAPTLGAAAPQTGAGKDAPSSSASGVGADDDAAGAHTADEEIVMADDMAEMIDLDEEPPKAVKAAPPPPASPPPRRKRTVPPPLPRE